MPDSGDSHDTLLLDFGDIAMKRLLFSFLILELLSLAGCSEPRAAKQAASSTPTRPSDRDLDLLQGTWRIESSIWNGVAAPEIARTVTVLFEGDKFIVVDRDGYRQTETIHLMPDQNPKSIDSTSETRGRPLPGIYSLEGDVFKWCSAGGNNTIRPTSFDSRPGSKQSLMVLRRVKNSA
jgi:uncharacterized protein (TIGR03067 family)